MTTRYDAGARNVLGGELLACSLDPVTGFFRNGEKSVIDDLLRRINDPIGKLVGVTVKSMTQTEKNKVSMFGVRFESLVDKYPAREEQFKLV